ncbi:uncharacterized protein [Mycetomoellerius zeteki]|uniref:uncharacterized protein n=1 Tax=Mycetomoellerius zeteki TaxID=64791 RepID=UPI00084EBCD2|nr:PREDICTED: uncharacterized protein LOC108729567 [Trachymyrmex zeteki]
MDFIGRRYYKVNMFLLCSLGLWPSQTTKCIQIKPIFFYTLLCSFLFVQVKLLMDEVQNDWNALDDKKEIETLEKYAYIINVFTIILMLLLCISIIIFTFTEFLPILLDIVVPLNESRQHTTYVPMEYFIDPKKYFLLMLIHEIFAFTAGGFTIIATGTITLAYAQHTCGMLKIISFANHHTLSERYRAIVFRMSSGHLLDVCAVCEIIELSQRLWMDFFRTSDLDVLWMYNTMWYLAPISIQKLLLFVMQNSLKTHTLTLGHIFVTSLEGFSTVINTL